MSQKLSEKKDKPEELIQAKQLIDECKLDEAEQLIKNFEEKGGHILHDIVLCHLLKCELLYWQGFYEDVIKLAEKTYKESLGLGKNILSVDILLIMVNALVWLGPWDKHDIIKQGEEILKALPGKSSAVYKQRQAYIAFLKGWFYAQAHDVDQALEQFEISLSLREELGAKTEIALSVMGIAIVFMVKGNFNRAIKFSKQSKTIAEESGNKWCIGYSFMCMGLIHRTNGDFDRSIILFKRSLTIFKDLNNKFMMAWLYNNIGTVYGIRGELDRCIRYYEQALEIYKEFNNERRMASVYNNLSENYRMKGEFDRALDYIELSLALFRKSGNLRNIAGIYDYLIQI